MSMKAFSTCGALLSYIILGVLCLHIPAADAAVSAESGSFVKCTSSSCTNSISMGFQPKAVIFYWTTDTSITAFSTADGSSGVGMSDGTKVASVMSYSLDNDASGTSAEKNLMSTTSAITITVNGSTITASATVALTSTGFDVNWGSTNTSGAQYIFYYALGGDDITDAVVREYLLPVGVATYSASDSQLTFQPDFLFFINAEQ